MREKKVYVIVDGLGNYISPNQTECGWYFLTYTGDCTGFMFYSSKETAMYEMLMLNRLGYKFILECVCFKSIPEGMRIKNIAYDDLKLHKYG